MGIALADSDASGTAPREQPKADAAPEGALERIAAPLPVGPSPWEGFELGGADAVTGPVAVGGELEPGTLVGAYRAGIFPWPTCDEELRDQLWREFGQRIKAGEVPNLTPEKPPSLELPWWSSDPRCELSVGRAHLSRSFVSRLRKCGWTSTLNRSFREVVEACVRGQKERWLTPELIEAFCSLRRLGYAHSIEVWEDDQLVGGMYGVLTGGVFSGESMFFRRNDASKVALVDLLARLEEAGGTRLDAQTVTDHLLTMGAIAVPRKSFLRHLKAERDIEARLVSARLPVARLAP